MPDRAQTRRNAKTRMYAGSDEDFVVSVLGDPKETIPIAARVTNDLVKTLAGSHPGLEYDIELVAQRGSRKSARPLQGVEVFYRGSVEMRRLVREFYATELRRMKAHFDMHERL